MSFVVCFSPVQVFFVTLTQIYAKQRIVLINIIQRYSIREASLSFSGSFFFW